MRYRSIASVGAVMALLAISHAKLAHTARLTLPAKAQALAHTPDLSGVWLVHEFQPDASLGAKLPMSSWAEAKFKAADAETNDPRLNCLPHGVPIFMFSVMPIEILQVPGRVLMHLEDDSLLREISTDVQKHPKDLDISYNGDSIGKWEGDTLVVDTVGLKGTTWLDHVGHPHSDALHVVERIRRVDHNTLVDDFTFDDPKAYTKAWTVKQVYDLKPDWRIRENVCEENNKYRSREPTAPLRRKK